MAFITLPKVFLLLFMALMITSVSATKQYALKEDYPVLNLPYTFQESPYHFESIPRDCYCPYPPCRDMRCPGCGDFSFITSNATKLLGTLDIILEGDEHKTVQVLADLTTRRNYITSTLVKHLGLGTKVRKLNETDVHSIEIGCRNVTITEFVPLGIGTGIDDSYLRDKIFEVVPTHESECKEFVLPHLVLNLNFLYDAGALAINPAIFTRGEVGDLDQSDENIGVTHDRHDVKTCQALPSLSL
jgi:hypothetical protein